MSPEQRYSCQIKLPGFGLKAQKRLGRAKVLLVGVGGLGCPAAQYLAAAGVGNLTLLDFDTIGADNLHRQILFTKEDVGLPKVEVAKERLQKQNPDIKIESLNLRLSAANIMNIVKPYDVVLDCTDNFETRYLISDACVLAGIPVVYGAAYQYQGQVAVWNAPKKNGSRSPHYRDVYPTAEAAMAVDCATGGVIPTLTGIIGTMQANEAIKYLANLPGLLASQLLIFDAQTMQSQIIKLPATSKTQVFGLQKSFSDEVPTISAAKLKNSLQKYQLINVSAKDQSVLDIGGKHVPISDVLADRLKTKSVKPIVFYCARGNKSAAAVKFMQENYPEVKAYSLEGGVHAWQTQPAEV